MRIAIHQPNYIPWCGYFSKMMKCDIFVFLDDVLISPGQSYVYRAKINSFHGPNWLSVPTHRSQNEKIRDVTFADDHWVHKHLTSLKTNYGRCPFYKEVSSFLEPIYYNSGNKISEFNIRIIMRISEYLEIPCTFKLASIINPKGESDERLISIAKILLADTYISGKGGKNYQDPEKFNAAGIDLVVQEYNPIPYDQIHGEFVAGLSIIDALFNLGRKAHGIL